jgi:hypothetical protein
LRKVAYWCVHGDAENLESLVDETIKGNYQKVTENFSVFFNRSISSLIIRYSLV